MPNSLCPSMRSSTHERSRSVKHRKVLLAMALASSALVAAPVAKACGKRCAAKSEQTKCGPRKDGKCAKK